MFPRVYSDPLTKFIFIILQLFPTQPPFLHLLRPPYYLERKSKYEKNGLRLLSFLWSVSDKTSK